MKFKFMVPFIFLFLFACSGKPMPYHYTIATFLREERQIDVRQPVPLVSLNNFLGEHGEIHGQFNFFLFGGSGSINGTSTSATFLQFALRAGDKISIVEIPINKIDFQIWQQEDPAVKLNVQSDWQIPSDSRPYHYERARKYFYDDEPDKDTTSTLLSKYITKVNIFLTMNQFNKIAPMVKGT